MNECMRTGQQMAVVANAIAVAISKNLTPTEENILGNLITAVGASLLSIAAIDDALADSGKNDGDEQQKNTCSS